MHYQEFDPPADLQSWIANLWRFEVEPGDAVPFEHVIVPDGTLSISFGEFTSGSPSPIVFAGPSKVAHRLTIFQSTSYIGARIHPAATGPLLGIDPSRLRGRMGLLAMVAPAAATSLSASLATKTKDQPASMCDLEEGIRTLTRTAQSPDPIVVRAVDDILVSHGTLPVSRITARSGISARQMRRKFSSHVGLSPKEFARIRRIRKACIIMIEDEARALAGISHEGGYADQPHLSREFRSIFGSTPRLVEAYLRRIEHVGVKGLNGVSVSSKTLV